MAPCSRPTSRFFLSPSSQKGWDERSADLEICCDASGHWEQPCFSVAFRGFREHNIFNPAAFVPSTCEYGEWRSQRPSLQTRRFLLEALGSGGARAPYWGARLSLALHRLPPPRHPTFYLHTLPSMPARCRSPAMHFQSDCRRQRTREPSSRT